MTTLDLHEQEQVEALKGWWKANGRNVILALMLVLAGFAGMQGWRMYKDKQSGEAAALYSDLLQQMSSRDARRINDAADAVTGKFPSSAYAPRAALIAAQSDISLNDAAHAKSRLQWVIDHANDEPTLKDVARLKLAGLLLDEKDYTGAIALLDAPHPDTFAALYSDLKGDVLNAEGKQDDARAAYQLALNTVDAKSPYRALIQMKLDSTGGKQATGLKADEIGSIKPGATADNASGAAGMKLELPAGNAK